MLNKLEFNNLVITHKKEIQKARTQTINKLVHKVRRLKNEMERQSQQANKLKEKLMKTTETIKHLKGLKAIDLIKQVLLLDKQPITYITNALSTPDELGTAFLALNTIMASLVDKFKAALCLDDKTNAQWREELQETSKRKQKLQRIEVKKLKRKHLKQQKALERSRQEWLKEHGITNEETDNNITNLEELQVEEVKPVITTKEKKLKTDKKFKKHTKETEDINPTKKQQMNPFDAINEEFNKKDTEDKNAAEEVIYAVDPFFVTDSGENYLSTAVPKTHDQPSEENNILKKPKFPADIKKDQRRFPNNKNVNNLHPSWAAKQKPMIANFKDKKITFEKNKEKVTVKSCINENNNDLHPSWAAKQKLKPIITAFEGKKIVFTDDE